MKQVKFKELTIAHRAFQDKFVKAAIKIQRAYRRYKFFSCMGMVMEQAKKKTKKRIKDIIREIEIDTTYDPRRPGHKEEVIDTKKKSREE